MQESLVHQVDKATQALVVLRVLKESGAQKVKLDVLDPRVPLVPLAIKEIKATWVHAVLQERKVPRVIVASLA